MALWGLEPSGKPTAPKLKPSSVRVREKGCQWPTSPAEGRSHPLANLSEELNGVKMAHKKVCPLPNNRAGPSGGPGPCTGMPRGVFCLPHTALSQGTAEAQPRDIGSEVDRGWGGGGAFISPR